MDGRGLNPFNHHFLPAGTKPPLTGWKRTSIFLLGFIQCQKAFTASARVLGMQRQCPGRAGGWVASPPSPPPPSHPCQHPAPGGDTPRLSPTRQGQRATAAGERAGGQGRGGGGGRGFPELWFNPAGKLHGSALAGARDGEGTGGLCGLPPPLLRRWLFNQTFVVLARKRGRQVPASPSRHSAQHPSCICPGKTPQLPN